MSFKSFRDHYQPESFDFNRHNFKDRDLKDQIQYLPSFVNAYLLAQISQLTYKSSVKADHSDEGFKEAIRSTLMNSGISYSDAQQMEFLNSREIEQDEKGTYTSGTQCLIIYHQKTAFIAFRGSEKKANDWLFNFNLKRELFDYGEGKVHKGFLKAFKAIIPNNENQNSFHDQLIEKLKKDCNYIWLTGHSLGGAIAIIAAHYLHKQGVKISGVYTFGAPRVGNKYYRNYTNRIFNNKYWRFTHDHDIVPDLPFGRRVTGYSREGCMLRLKSRYDEQQKKNQSQYQLLRIVNGEGLPKQYERYHGYNPIDHDMTEYINRLLEFIEQNPELIKQQDPTLSDDLQKVKLEILQEGKLMGENPEVLALKRHVLMYFSQSDLNFDLNEIIKEFQISPNLVESVKKLNK